MTPILGKSFSLVEWLAKRAGLVQLVVDHGLIQVVSLETEPFDFLG